MFTPRSVCASCFLVLGLLSPVLAQVAQPDNVEQAAVQLTSTSTVTVSAGAKRVRFTAPSSTTAMRVEVYSVAGERLFDSSEHAGNVLDWSLQDGQAERVGDGSYLCVVTVKSLSGKVSRKLGTVVVQEKQVVVQPVDAAQLTLEQSQVVSQGSAAKDQVEAISSLGSTSALTVVSEGEPEAITTVAHDGTQGQINRSRGALSFRLGDFYSGKDTEQMRLSEEGNLGIGTDSPQAKLDVAGVIRTSKGIEFDNGINVTTLASTATGSLQQTLADGTVVANATGTGTEHKIAKWTDNAGTLGDSNIHEGANARVGIGTTSPGAKFHVIGVQGSIGAGTFQLDRWPSHQKRLACLGQIHRHRCYRLSRASYRSARQIALAMSASAPSARAPSSTSAARSKSTRRLPELAPRYAATAALA